MKVEVTSGDDAYVDLERQLTAALARDCVTRSWSPTVGPVRTLADALAGPSVNHGHVPAV